VLLGNARLAERVQTRESLGPRVDVEADLAQQKLVVDVLHQLLASRHDGAGGCLEPPRLSQSSAEQPLIEHSIRVDRGTDFYIPIPSYSHAVSSHSFPFPSLCLITVPMGFPLGYSHSHPIPQTRTAKQ